LNPLVLWVWIGGWILVVGTLIALLPNKKSAPNRRGKPASQVKEDAGVEQTA